MRQEDFRGKFQRGRLVKMEIPTRADGSMNLPLLVETAGNCIAIDPEGDPIEIKVDNKEQIQEVIAAFPAESYRTQLRSRDQDYIIEVRGIF